MKLTLILASLMVVVVSNAQVGQSPKQMEDASPESQITILDLSGMNLTEVPDAVRKYANLRILNLADNKISSLPGYLKKLTHLEEINLSNNQIQSSEFKTPRLKNP